MQPTSIGGVLWASGEDLPMLPFPSSERPETSSSSKDIILPGTLLLPLFPPEINLQTITTNNHDKTQCRVVFLIKPQVRCVLLIFVTSPVNDSMFIYLLKSDYFWSVMCLLDVKTLKLKYYFRYMYSWAWILQLLCQKYIDSNWMSKRSKQ